MYSCLGECYEDYLKGSCIFRNTIERVSGFCIYAHPLNSYAVPDKLSPWKAPTCYSMDPVISFNENKYLIYILAFIYLLSLLLKGN